MIRRRRAPLLAAALAALAGALMTSAPISATAATDDSLAVRITSLSPETLDDDTDTVTLGGVVTNTGDRAWTDVQAYLVIRASALNRRQQVAGQGDVPGFAGSRIVEAGRFDELGTIAPGASTTFRLRVPRDRLPIDGSEGVFPIGVQILGTDADGRRDNDAVARATTLLPRLTGRHTPAPTTLVWPLLMPTGNAGIRLPNGQFRDPRALLDQLGPGGMARHRLDQAAATPADRRGVLVDPALVAAAADLAEGRGSALDLTAQDREVAQSFLDDLTELADGPSAWVLDYDRADVLAIAGAGEGRQLLFDAIARVTDAVVAAHRLPSSRVSWPTRSGVTTALLGQLRQRGDDPVVVDASSLPDWELGDGPLVRRSTRAGDAPLLVDDFVARGLPGQATSTTVRQGVLAGAALASLDRDATADSAAASVVVVDPAWDPGAPTGDLDVEADYVEPRSLAQVSPTSRYEGRVRAGTASPIKAAQLIPLVEAARTADLLGTAATDGRSFDDAQARRVADLLGVRWRSDRTDGGQEARELQNSLAADLGAVTISGPGAVTLSSSAGAFPVTISNGSDIPMSVAVRLESSNPALTLPSTKPVEIAAGERQTITIDVDLEQQTATTITARLTTADGRDFGGSSVFNVRTSHVGVVLWSTMALAGVGVLFALVRRFRGSRRGRPATEGGTSDE